jgi:post-segregation antitoxin (ccd killing protein)
MSTLHILYELSSTKSLYTQISYSKGWWPLSTAVLSVRVRKELKEEAEKLGINLKEVIEKALKAEIERAKMERMKSLIGEALRSMDLKEEEWVKAVRESRLER